LAVLENFLPVYIDEFNPIFHSTELSETEKLHKFLKIHMGRVEDRSDILSINLRDTKCLSGKNKLIYQEQQKVH